MAAPMLAMAGLSLLPACSTVSQDPPAVVENSLGMSFVLVPAGEFPMGRGESVESLARDFPQYERARLLALADETPQHRVRITRPTYFGRHEVTVGQFRRFLAASRYAPESERDGTGGYGYNPEWDPARSARGDTFEGRDKRYSWRNTGFAQDDDHPVLNVTWNDAIAMARWLSAREGRKYRLPTEAEWEYACLAGSNTRYYNGDDPGDLARIANTFDADSAAVWPRWQSFAQPDSDGFAFTAPVGSFPPNAFGIYDMIGNAWEWVSDWYGEDYYAISPTNDPQGPDSGNVRVRRGGSWHTWSLYARCSFRNWNTPQTRYALVGIRLILETGPGDR